MRRASEPSFARYIARTNRHKASPYVRALLDKQRMRRLAQLLGGTVPRLIAELPSITALTPSHLTESVVLKPQRSSNNRGVLALIPTGADVWFNPINNEHLSFDDIVGRSSLALRREQFDDAWVIEESIQSVDDPLRPIDDVKLCFVGERFVCGFVRQQRPRAFRWFDHQLRDIDPGVHSAHMDARLRLPNDLEEHIAIARQISSGIPISFLRVDLYPGANGPVVGELTPLPGWYALLNDEWDRHLGELVEAQEARIIQTGVDWARLSPSPEVFAAVATC